MITIGYSTRIPNSTFTEYLNKSCGLKNVQVIEKINNGEKSLSQVYNEIIDESSNNILVLCHDDIKLETGWGKKLLKDFEENQEFGIIGKAGSCYFPESGVYWEKMQQTMVGQVYHHPDGQKKWLSKYSPKLPFLVPVITIDGLFIGFDKTKIKHRFDETIGKFHFYDHGFCVPNYLDGVKIGVTSSFEITHKSVGRPNEEFWISKNQFLQKWGHKLPLDLKPEKIYVPEILEKPLKNIGKVAVIIPTKGKVDMLYNCIKSYYEQCNSNLFTIFIADTGSNNEEKLWIKENILNLGDIKFIEYDYYNFAKINNDVVKNHIDDSYEFLLFSNNDIKILNNVIYGMLKVFKDNSKAGTVGARLHFGDKTVQHDGIFLVHNQKFDKIDVGHIGFKNYFNHKTSIDTTLGNTGGLLMIRKNLFKSLNYFNENYISCFEDVELNLSCQIKGYKNFTDSSLVAYHFESSTRNDDEENLKKLQFDFSKNLLPFIKSNWEKIKNKIHHA
jgi:GT2 family glycosyltransferase